MTASKAQQKAQNKWISKAYDRINLTVVKGRREIIKAHAEAHGESVNGFINRAIDETMEREHRNCSRIAWGIARSALDGSFRPSHIGRRKRVPGRHKTWNESELDRLKKESLGLPLGLTQFAPQEGGGGYCIPGLPQVSPSIPEKNKRGKRNTARFGGISWR